MAERKHISLTEAADLVDELELLDCPSCGHPLPEELRKRGYCQFCEEDDGFVVIDWEDEF